MHSEQKNIDTQDKLNLAFCFILNFAPKTVLFDYFQTIFWTNLVRFFWMLLTRIVRKKGETLPSSIPQYFTHNGAQWTKSIETQDKLNLIFCFALFQNSRQNVAIICGQQEPPSKNFSLRARIADSAQEGRDIVVLHPKIFHPQRCTLNKKHWHSGQIEFNILFCFEFRAKNSLVWRF